MKRRYLNFLSKERNVAERNEATPSAREGDGEEVRRENVTISRLDESWVNQSVL